jgi:hypothetical protein
MTLYASRVVMDSLQARDLGEPIGGADGKDVGMWRPIERPRARDVGSSCESSGEPISTARARRHARFMTTADPALSALLSTSCAAAAMVWLGLKRHRLEQRNRPRRCPACGRLRDSVAGCACSP